MQAPLIEVFTSIQGEGPHIGYRHLFIRMAGCNRACAYCDTPRTIPTSCLLETTPGRGDFRRVPNPLCPETLLEHIAGIPSSLYEAVSLTGGEPLLYPEFLASVLPALRSLGWTVYLETNGTLPDSLAQIITFCDIIAMDYKLPSTTGQPLPQEQHAAFLRCARHKCLFVKAVVSAATPVTEIAAAAQAIAREAPDAPLILQPVTAQHGKGPRTLTEHLLDLQETAMDYIPAVRVIPQAHVVLGIR